MGKDFTFHNVRVVVQAIAGYLQRKFPDRTVSVVVGYDTRFLSERFAYEAAKLLSKNRIHVFLAERDVPSQALAYQIIKRRCQGGINFTASFNPPEYNGLKFNVETGAPALPDVTDAIEEEARRLMPGFAFIPFYPHKENIARIDLQADYLDFIRDKIDFAAMKNSGIKVGVDLLYGTSREYLDEILEENDVLIEEIHGYVDPYFGGVIPSCTEKNLLELKKLVREKGCHVGIATDGDGDRFGIIDEKGNFVDQNYILAMLLDYFVHTKGWRGGVARSVTTTHLIDRIARSEQLPVYKTKVGFKYIADLFLGGKIIFGGEESACLAVKDHLPEKDGIFAGLLVAEMVAVTGRRLGDLKKSLFKDYGTMLSQQRNIPQNPERTKTLKALIKTPPQKLGNWRVLDAETEDGLKLGLKGDAWFLVRFSGTEPLIRCYGEAENKKDLEVLMKKGMELVL